MRSSRALLAVGLATTALLFSGCGDTKSDNASDAPADAGTAKDCAADAGEPVTVTIGDFVFDPTPVQVGVCDSVVWTNGHTQPHTSTGQGDQAWSTGNIQPGASSEPVRFESAGSFAYICALHPFMQGTVEVT